MWLNNWEETELENLPFRENRAANLTRRYGDMWNVIYYRYRCRWNDQKLAKRMIEQAVGKSFAKEFSKFCSKVEQRYQYLFLDYFETFRSYVAEYYIDEKGLIQEYKGENAPIYKRYKRYKNHLKRPIVFTSFNFKEEWKFTGAGCEAKSYYSFMDNYSNHEENPNYSKVIVSGYRKEFDRPSDPILLKLRAERRKQYKLDKKRNRGSYNHMDEETFRYWLNYNKLNEERTSKQKLEAKGFDPVKSFRNH